MPVEEDADLTGTLEYGLKCRGHDVIFNKLGLEEEDIAIVVKGLDAPQNPDFVKLIKEYKYAEQQFSKFLYVMSNSQGMANNEFGKEE